MREPTMEVAFIAFVRGAKAQYHDKFFRIVCVPASSGSPLCAVPDLDLAVTPSQFGTLEVDERLHRLSNRPVIKQRSHAL